MSYRWDWTVKGHKAGDGAAMTADHGGVSKRLAPVPAALEEETMYWSRTAAHAAKEARRVGSAASSKL